MCPTGALRKLFGAPDIIQERGSRTAVGALSAKAHKSLRPLLILKVALLIFNIYRGELEPMERKTYFVGVAV